MERKRGTFVWRPALKLFVGIDIGRGKSEPRPGLRVFLSLSVTTVQQTSGARE